MQTSEPSISHAPDPESRAEPDMLDLWALRLLRALGTNSRLLDCIRHTAGGVRELLVPEGTKPPKSVDDLGRRVDAGLAAVEARGATLPAHVARNLALLGERVPMTPAEEAVLLARALYRTSDAWADAIGVVGGNCVSDSRIARIIGAAACMSSSDIAHALRADGALRTVGLLDYDGRLGPFEQRLTPLPGLPGALLRENASADELMAFAAQKSAPGSLLLEEFPHLQEEIDLVRDYFRGAAATAMPGINVLLHGTPGMGKTELARALAESLGWTLYAVASGPPRSEGPSGPRGRFRRYLFLQQFLSRTGNTMILFDEVEDVFPVRPTASAEQGIAKAEMNGALESNPVPAIWISNRVDHLDRAYLRRFDLIVEVGPPPRSVRKRLLEAALGAPADCSSGLDRVASARDLAPAVLARAARVASQAGPRGQGTDAKVERLELALRGYREATNADGDMEALALPRSYDLELVNASEPLAVVTASLARHRQGRVLLHGPPGTGKTAYANHVALELDRPLLLKRASDILSPWLGQSEQSARRMFDEAGDEGAVLFLDEADSLLRDRLGAIGRWEAPVVNELLTGMERFRGVFICATNMLEALDPASLRRFTFKIRFDWLDEDQRWRMLERTFPALIEQARPTERARARQALSCLDMLAPGDFAVVAERARLGMNVDSLERVILGLEEESRCKPGGRARIGF